jgi:hypothetical protein
MNSRERTEAHFLKVAQKLKAGAEAKASSTQGTSQQRTSAHYLNVARKMKGSL